MIDDRRWRVQIHAGALILLLTGFSPALAGESYQPKSGQLGKDVVWVGNPEAMVHKMLDVAGITPQDYVVDLGSGDGRNVIAAAKRGARAHGIEYNGDLVEMAKSLAAKERLRGRASFERADVFAADFSKATVVVLFLTPEMNIRLRPKLLALKPGARIVANTFAIGDWSPDQTSRFRITAKNSVMAVCGLCRRESPGSGNCRRVSSSSSRATKAFPAF